MDLTTGFMNKMKYDLPVYSELSTTPTELQSQSIPATFLIDKSGKIVVSETGSADWNTKKVHAVIDKLLKE